MERWRDRAGDVEMLQAPPCHLRYALTCSSPPSTFLPVLGKRFPQTPLSRLRSRRGRVGDRDHHGGLGPGRSGEWASPSFCLPPGLGRHLPVPAPVGVWGPWAGVSTPPLQDPSVDARTSATVWTQLPGCGPAWQVPEPLSRAPARPAGHDRACRWGSAAGSQWQCPRCHQCQRPLGSTLCPGEHKGKCLGRRRRGVSAAGGRVRVLGSPGQGAGAGQPGAGCGCLGFPQLAHGGPCPGRGQGTLGGPGDLTSDHFLTVWPSVVAGGR